MGQLRKYQRPIRYHYDAEGHISYRKVTRKQDAVSCRWLLAMLMRETGGETLDESCELYRLRNEIDFSERPLPAHGAARG